MEKTIKNCHPIRMDMASVSDIQKKIGGLSRRGVVFDALVNNAAVSQIMPLAMIEEADVDRVMAVNIKGTLFVTKSVVKGMIQRKRGVIVNMGSIAGHRMLDVPVTYAMSKAAVSGMTIALASELKRFGIRVNSVVPGLMEGGVSKGIPEDLKSEFLKHCAVGRPGRAGDVAELVCFLLSDRSAYIDGQNVFVDGGI